MRDDDCVALLQWALPLLRLRWPGYRKVRRQVCKRIQRRIDALDISLDDYRELVAREATERERLDGYCRITISRFYRDQGTWQALERDVLPRLAQGARDGGRDMLRAWSIGCASGEEPYTLSMLWRLSLSKDLSGLSIDILATDSEPQMIARAQRACYAWGSLKDLPADWRGAAFDREDAQYCLCREYRTSVRLREHDVRDESPSGPFDLILCKNLVFTYFAEDLQRVILSRLLGVLRSGGVLVLGAHESLPRPPPALAPAGRAIFRYRPANAA